MLTALYFKGRHYFKRKHLRDAEVSPVDYRLSERAIMRLVAEREFGFFSTEFGQRFSIQSTYDGVTVSYEKTALDKERKVTYRFGEIIDLEAEVAFKRRKWGLP